MANVTDYLRWRGDITLSERPFNCVDNLVLATLAYVDFTDVVPTEEEGGSVALSDACERVIELADGNIASRIRSLAHVTQEFLEQLARSERFGGARLRAYADVRDSDRSIQFAALTIEPQGAEPYVSFRGTDSTLVGWKENFMLTFQVSHAQFAAARYLSRRMQEGGIYQVGGHSKGGNLATYAAMCSSGGELARLSHVWSNDGPGMAPEVLPAGGYERLGSKLTRIVPTFTFVGMFFDSPQVPKLIVHSNGGYAYQHDPLTWQVERDEFAWADQLDEDCMVINNTLANWVGDLPLEDRAHFTNKLFEALEDSGAVTLSDVTRPSTPTQFAKVWSSLSSPDERSHSIFRKLIATASSQMALASRRQAKTAMQTMRAEADRFISTLAAFDADLSVDAFEEEEEEAETQAEAEQDVQVLQDAVVEAEARDAVVEPAVAEPEDAPDAAEPEPADAEPADAEPAEAPSPHAQDVPRS